MAFAKLGDGERAEALFALLNPVNHSRTPQDAARYAVEPYVVAADVYALPPHAGRGGWTWYTGSAGWLQRAGMESILGLHLSAGMLHIDPCIPKAWPGFEAQLRHGSASYVITIRNPSGVMRGILAAEQDGEAISARPLQIPLQTTGTHTITVILGGPALHA